MRKALLSLSFALITFISGCSSGSKPISVALTPTGSQAIDLGQSVVLSAAVANDSKNAGVTWTSNGPGSLTGQSATGVTYVAPATGTGGAAMVTATTVSLPSATAVLTINVTAPPSITTTSLPAATEGTAYSQSVKVTGGAGTLTYSLSVGTLPAGLTLNSSGNITGTPTGPNTTSNFTVKVMDASTAGAQSTTQALSIAVNLPPAPAITTTSLPAVVEGATYNQTIAATGFAPLTYSVSAGTLPAGLSLNSSTGAITGTPAGPNGTANFTIKVSDSSNPVQSATQALSIAVNLPPAPAITTASLPAVVEGAAYNQTITVTGGLAPLTFSLSAGSLPAGLSMNGSTGAITGTPTGPNGTTNFTIKVTDKSNPVQSATKALSIAVNLPPAPAITTTTLPSVVEFASYSQTIAATGFGTLTYSVSVGSLPAGLSLNSSTGAITGTPTGPNATTNFTVKVTDSSNPVQSATQALSIVVTLPPAPAITTTTLPNATIGAAYSQTIGFTGGHAPFALSIFVGTLPTGLSLNSTTGAITGNPSLTGVFNFTVKLVDSSNPAQSATQALSITVVNGPLTVAAATLPTGAVNDVYPSTNLGASGGLPPYTWSITVGSLPAGLALNASTGAITGTPMGPSGTASFTAQVKDSTNATATGNFSIVVNPTLAVSSTSLPGGTVGNPYTTNLTATGGVTPYTWTISAGTLPGGLSLSGNTISGTPGASGTFNFTVRATDASGGSATAAVSIVVAPAPPLTVSTVTSSLPPGTLNSAYPATNLSANGGVQPYTWSITVGALPTGLILTASTGAITGTPTVSGTFNFTAQVKDSVNNTATAALSITVNVNACAGYGTGSESELHGQYAILTQGFKGTGALVGFAGTGSFAADGTGKITSGDFDINGGSAGPQHLIVSATGSSYKLGTDNRGCLQISFGGNNSVTMHFAVGGISAGIASKGRLIEFDDTDGSNTRDSGVLRLQTSTDFSLSKLNARYAFGIDGTDTTGGHVAAGGSFSLNTSTGAISNGFADVDDAGTLPGGTGGFTGATGSIGAISTTTGRATGSFVAGTGGTFNLVYYVVNKNELFVITSDVPAAGKPAASGRILVTGSSFSSSSLNGNYIVHLNGSSSGTANSNLGLLTLTGGTLNGTLFQYNGAVASSNSITGGTYTVDATSGRVTLTASGNHPPVLYLTTATDGISAFIIGTDNAGEFGEAEVQPAATYSTSSLSGSFFFGNDDDSDNSAKNEVGTVTITSGSVNGLQDSSQPTSPFLQTGKSVTGTLVINSDGTGNLGTGTVLITNGTKIFFMDESGGPARINIIEQ
jgi:Putative Ig domain